MSAEKPMPAKHLDYLDSARGIAACMVLGGHYLNLHFGDKRWAIAGNLVFNGNDAVSFFFVLSGFVLSYKYVVLEEPLDLRKFYVNRLFRLWPAFFVTVLLNTLEMLYRVGITPQVLADAFLYNKYKFWEEALLPWTRANYYLPGWTLIIELGASFFIPFIIVTGKKDVRLLYYMAFVFLAFLPLGFTFHAHFVAGVVLCFFYKRWVSAPGITSWWTRYPWLIAIAASTLFSIGVIDRLWPFGPTYGYLSKYVGIVFQHYTGVASFLFLGLILTGKNAKRFLRNRVLLFIGKVSYGIYLMHWLLVCGIFRYWDRIVAHFSSEAQAYIIVFLAYAGATLLLATLLHYAVELPFIRLGKKLTSKLKKSAALV